MTRGHNRPRPASGSSGSLGVSRPAQDAVKIVIAQQAARVETVAQREELVETRVAVPEGIGIEGVQLAPVRPPADFPDDVLHETEVVRVIGASGYVHGEVAAGA